MLFWLFVVGGRTRTRAFPIGVRHARGFFGARFDQDSDTEWGWKPMGHRTIYEQEDGAGPHQRGAGVARSHVKCGGSVLPQVSMGDLN
ncbi:hypothetical protein EDB84DRAFT_1549305 [Lactarius hengduanensis]|nr:hypothetical protein EDB84DRAFT_1549305 [Lactarius hengduanensis]